MSLHCKKSSPENDKRCSRSLSMDELTSLAREICSPRQTGASGKENHQIGKANVSKSPADNEEPPNRYHSWPKKSMRKKRLLRGSFKGQKACNMIQPTKIVCHCKQNLFNGASYDKAFYHSEEEMKQFSTATRPRIHSDYLSQGIAKDKRDFDDDGGDQDDYNDRKSRIQAPLNSLVCEKSWLSDNLDVPSMPKEKAFENDPKYNSIHHHYHVSCFPDEPHRPFFLVKEKYDISTRLKNRSALSAAHRANTVGSEASWTCEITEKSSITMQEGLDNQRMFVHENECGRIQKSDEGNLNSSINIKNEVGETEDFYINTLKVDDEDMLQGISSTHTGDENSVTKTLIGNIEDSSLEKKLFQGSICNSPLSGNHTEESSESSDSGVGNLRYDIILKKWNEPAVNGPLFKKRLEILKQWYIQFDNNQKNLVLNMLLENSQLPQMHMLSEIMENSLHKGCPPNCRDFLNWLPSTIIYRILSFLDPVSLAKASLVNKSWYGYCEDGRLWRQFCFYPDMQLSPAREREQIVKYTKEDGSIQWKKVFLLRYCLRRNWLNGKCTIRTFTGHSQAIFCVQFDETRIVSGSSDKTIKVWDIKGIRTDPILTLVGHSGAVRCLHLDGNRLVSGSADATIKVWDLVEGRDWSSAACKVTMVGHINIVRCLQVDDEKIVSGSYDKTLKLWDIKTGVCKKTYRGHWAPVLCVQFDSEKIVSGSADRTIKVWSIKTGSCLNTIAGHTEAVTCLQFNSHRIFSGSLDRSLKFWDLNSSQCIGTIDWIRSEGHTRVVRCLQADSWKIVSAGDDKALKIWSLETGKRFVTLRDHTDGVTCLHFNDHMIVSGSYDKSVKLWDFSPDDNNMV